MKAAPEGPSAGAGAATPAGTRSPLSCLGCGCAGGVAVILAVVVSLTWIGYRSAERYREEMSDPAAREARVQALLPHRDLPPGYRALGGISIPFMMRMAVLADRAPRAAGAPADQAAADRPVEAGFLFVETRGGFGRRKRLAELFAQEHPDPKSFSQGEVGFEVREEIGRGEVEAGGAAVHYYARRGELAVDQSRFGVEPPAGASGARSGDGDDAAALHRYPGLATMMLVDCPADDRVRVALWFARDPHPDQAISEADLAGTPGDPAALAAFLDHFRLCG